MRAGYILSGILHGTILLLVLLGLPDWFKAKLPEEQPIAVQLVNISDLTRALKRNPHPIEQAKLDTPVPDNPSKAPPEQKPDPLAPPPPPPAAAARTPDEDTDDQTPTPPEPQKPQPKVADAPPPPAPPRPAKAPPPPKQKPPKQVAKLPKPKPVKTVKPKPVKKKAPKATQDLDFDSLLKNLSADAKTLEKSNQPPRHVAHAPPPQEASAQPDAPLGDQLTTSEIDAVRSQIERCWSPPAGAKDEDKIVVPIKLTINQDGTVASAVIDDKWGYYNSDPLWQAVADSAVRAVNNPSCSPLKLPPDKYDMWKSTTINFSPQDLS